MSALGELRFETLQTRLRGDIGGRFVVDSTAALLVWEPERFLPSHAVPAEHVLGDLVAAAGASHAHAPADEPSAFDPRSAFSVHTAAGTRLDIRAGGDVLTDAAFRFAVGHRGQCMPTPRTRGGVAPHRRVEVTGDEDGGRLQELRHAQTLTRRPV